MKKILYILPALFLAVNLCAAQAADKPALPKGAKERPAMTEEQKAQRKEAREAFKAQREAKKAEIDGFVAAYNKPGATDKEKAEAEKGLKKIVAADADKNLERHQKGLTAMEKRMKEAKKDFSDKKKNKNKFVDEQTKAILNGEKAGPMFGPMMRGGMPGEGFGRGPVMDGEHIMGMGPRPCGCDKHKEEGKDARPCACGKDRKEGRPMMKKFDKPAEEVKK